MAGDRGKVFNLQPAVTAALPLWLTWDGDKGVKDGG